MTVFDYWQVVLNGAFRALGKLNIFSIFNLISYFGLVLPFTVVFVFFVGSHEEYDSEMKLITIKGLG